MPAETKPKLKIEVPLRHGAMDGFSVLIHARQAQHAHSNGHAMPVYVTSLSKNLSICLNHSKRKLAPRVTGEPVRICRIGQDAQSPATASAAFSFVLVAAPLP